PRPKAEAHWPGPPENHHAATNQKATPVGCSGWILMKALLCDGGGGTQPPPAALTRTGGLPALLHPRPPTPDSTRVPIRTPGPSRSLASTQGPPARPDALR